MTDRPNCRDAAACRAKTPGKHCSPCVLSALHKDPAFRAKRREAFAAKMRGDPEFRAKHVAASSARLAKWRASAECILGRNIVSLANLAKANEEQAVSARIRAVREKAFAGIPEDRWDECLALGRRMPAAEAKRIIMDDERAKARRRIQEFDAEQRARREREKRQAY